MKVFGYNYLFNAKKIKAKLYFSALIQKNFYEK